VVQLKVVEVWQAQWPAGMSCVRSEGTLSRSEFIPNQIAYPKPAKTKDKEQIAMMQKLRIVRPIMVGAMSSQE
jgi:hypothetical protein